MVVDHRVGDELAVLEPKIGRLLRVGVFVSGSMTFLGLIVSWLRPGSTGFTPADLAALRNGRELVGPVVPRTIAEICTGLASGNATTFAAIGLMALIALPILRVLLTSILFFVQKDYLYFFLTVIVLGTLTFGIVIGKGAV